MSRELAAKAMVIVTALSGVAVGGPLSLGCNKKQEAPPPPNTYQVGSMVINLPPSVSVPLPQGRPDEPTVNQTKCNYVVDKKIDFMSKANPAYKDSLKQAKPSIMQECLTKWTQQQYDCMVAAKDLQTMLYCKRFQRP